MLKVGLTGGIGSGKSLVSKIFLTLGVPVYFSDDAARKLTDTDPDLKQSIIALLGEQSYGPDGLMNRKWVAGKVFKDPALLQKLNMLVHPAVAVDFKQWLEARHDVSYVIREAAIHFESGAHKEMDVMITVSAPESLRIQRVMKRDGTMEKEVRSRLANQLTDEEREQRSQYVIRNNDHQLVIPQVLQIHENIKSTADQRG
ncbi:MAG: dephospho-CoA kinase [Flavobacteriales bacterium]|nr:dephospho-CoA kinase [Flavobacteriales bacterium]